MPLRIAVVGMGFGAAFVPIYQAHPDVAGVVVCDPNLDLLNAVADRHGIADRFASLEEVLADREIDAVHLLSPVRFHVDGTLAVLAAGKHCACAVPMATSLEDLGRIVEAQREAGVNYMMMETAVYTREFLYVQDLYRRGELGNLTFLRGAHIQDIEGYAEYWRGYPFMLYATHAVAPILALAETRAEKVCCFGSGALRPDLHGAYADPFPLEVALMRLAGTPIAAEVTGAFFQTARPYVESFTVYGDRMGFEWPVLEEESPYIFRLEPLPAGGRGRPTTVERVEVPYRPDLLPPELAPFAEGGHGGSHPHLVHEFVRSIVERRSPRIDAAPAATWTAPGICAHMSAVKDGEMIKVPTYLGVRELAPALEVPGSA
ncbi:MAG: Gfo/Idh/MocA family protein [Fimbriimonas sp.]